MHALPQHHRPRIRMDLFVLILKGRLLYLFFFFLRRMSDDEVFEPPDDGSANYTHIEADRIKPGSYGEPSPLNSNLFACVRLLKALSRLRTDFALVFFVLFFCPHFDLILPGESHATRLLPRTSFHRVSTQFSLSWELVHTFLRKYAPFHGLCVLSKLLLLDPVSSCFRGLYPISLYFRPTILH